jgi:hypothetical protein
MAYQNKYKATFATKSGKIIYLYLLEDGYTGDIIEYPGVNIELQYLPTSDDPFEPIYASQLNIVLDITDNLEDMPNLVTLNDRKYNAQLFIDSSLEWQGWTLSDSVQINYSTGRRQLSLNAVDGLALLKDISLPIPDTQNINSINTLLYYITTCLNLIQFPSNPNLKTVCSYYAIGMDNRDDDPAAEPFNQTYLPYRTFIKNNEYISCFDVLNNLIKSFGCRLFQAGGKWWVVSVNEFANIDAYYTEYDYLMAVVSSGTINTLSTIQGYTGNTSQLYFIDNSQIKLLRKGYNRVEQTVSVSNAENYASNGTFKPYIGNYAVNWDIGTVFPGTVTLVDNPDFNSATYRLVRPGSSGTAFIAIEEASGGSPAKGPFLSSGVVLEVGWVFTGQDLGASPRGVVFLWITDGTLTYYWSGTGWVSGTITSMDVPAYTGTSGDDINNYSFKTAITPIAGQLHFKFQIEAGTGAFAAVRDFFIKTTTQVSQINYFGYLIDNKQYAKQIDIPYGYDSPNSIYPTELGIFMLSDGIAAGQWYEQGDATSYSSMLLLLIQKYMNIYGYNLINIDCNLSSFNTANGYLDGSKLFKATDTDPAQINVSANSYMLGNSTINYPTDQSQATLIQISNELVEATIGKTYIYNTII